MQTHYIAYYQHIAKLSQVANKQTVFLAHILYHMEFDSSLKQYYVDLSTARKISIMKKVTPGADPKGVLNRANQYINKLKKVGFIRSIGRGVWGVNPMCYGAQRPVSKDLRKDNAEIYSTAVFTKDGLQSVETAVASPAGDELYFESVNYVEECDRHE